MKTKLSLLALILLGALLAGCMSSAELNKLQIGMTKDQVIALLGQPDSTSAQANVEYLTYYLEVSDVAYNRYSNEGEKAYMVRLVDGKVESFGRFLQLFDLYNRPVTNAKPGDPNFPSSSYTPYGQPVALPYGQPVPAAQMPVVQRAPAPMDIAGQLERLKRLKDQGVLTDEEFQKAKEKILAEQK
jgi:hypothetical protein